MSIMNIMMVGVGGQGTLLASRIIGDVAVESGYDVKVSEVHGMSQRGGSVVTYVRYGSKVYSPIISEGSADIILAFEELEAYRWLSYLKKNGQMIVNTQQIDPMPVIIGAVDYPQHIIPQLQKQPVSITPVTALDIAMEAGNAKAVNVVLLGILAGQTDIPLHTWLKAVERNVPVKFLDINIKAFQAGYQYKAKEVSA